MTEQEQQAQTQTTDFSTRMQENFWGDGNGAAAQTTQQQTADNTTEQQNTQQQATTQQQQTTPEVPIEPTVWFKEQFKDFQWEDVEKAKADISDWKKAKDNPVKEELKFENEISKNIYAHLSKGELKQVTEILKTQEKLDTYLSTDVNADTASEIIKLGLQLKHPNLKDKELEFHFSQQYGVPKEPVQKSTESDEDFEERHNEWKSKKETVEMNRIVQAKIMMPELEAAKGKLVLPDITPKANQVTQPSPEDLQKATQFKESYLKSAAESLKNFKGFSHTVEDKDVKIPLSYGLSPEEVKVIDDKMKFFAEENFNTNALFADLWMNEDGTINTNKMAEDLSRLYFGDKVAQKFAADSQAQRMEQFLKEKKNINLNETRQNGTVPLTEKTQSQKLQEHFWGN